MNTPKVRVSNIDRGISVFTAVNTYQSRKLNEQILNQQYKNNKQLAAIRSQMTEANAINKQILANQLKAEEHKEAQKYYKALSFNLFETIDLISKIEDKMVLNYVMTNFYDKLKANINEANDQLDEIIDKTYNKQTLEKLNALKSKSDDTIHIFNANILNKVDNLIADFKAKELKLSSIKQPELVEEIIERERTNRFRTFGIAVLGLVTFLLFISTTINVDKGEISGDFFSFIFLVLPFAIPFIILLRKEIKWRKDFDDFVYNQKVKNQEFENKKSELNKKYEETLQKGKEELSSHPLNLAMAEISEKHPTFDEYLSEIVELEKTFSKKWGLVSEEKIEQEAFDQNIIKLCSEGKKLEAVDFCIKTKGWAKNKSNSYVNKLSYKHNIPVKAESGCFVATACYGDYDAPEVKVLRQFRDEILLKTFYGKTFVKFYYSVSPPFAKIISKSERLKKSVRHYFLTPIISKLHRQNNK
jgi:hypothetical protein